MAGVFTNKINPDLENPSNALIWASMNVMPKFLGIIVLSGVLASAVSSATTFLSLIGSNIVLDIIRVKGERKQLLLGRVVILIVAIAVKIGHFWQFFGVFSMFFVTKNITKNCAKMP